jgi:hypothetical protein
MDATCPRCEVATSMRPRISTPSEKRDEKKGSNDGALEPEKNFTQALALLWLF